MRQIPLANISIYVDGLLVAGGENLTTTTLDSNPITYSFQNVENDLQKSWEDNEVKSMEQALDTWSNVANIKFVQVSNNSKADFQLNLVKGSEVEDWKDPKDPEAPVTVLADFGVPGGNGQGIGRFNYEGDGWNESGLQQGGYGFSTLIHELGHGLGLKHPHDSDGAGAFPGVTGAFDIGDGLNQAVWTVMSYNDPIEDPAYKTMRDRGWSGTPMALDIAAIQHLYGANMSYKTGNDTYELPNQNTLGTFYSSLWDAGGIDAISAASAQTDATINLNAAPLMGKNAGGYISSVKDIYGGFTIANKVVIENAIGGDGDDKIIGNEVNNSLQGAGGTDTLVGGAGSDTFVFKSATGGTDTIQDFDRQEGDKILFDAPAQAIQFNYNAQTGELSFNNQVFVTLSNKPADFKIGTDLVFAEIPTPAPNPDPVPNPDPAPASGPIPLPMSLIGTDNNDVLVSRTDQGDSVFGLAGNDRIMGRLGNDTLDGGAGDDILSGEAGNDSMSGGPGDDFYTVDSSGDAITEAIDGGNDSVSASIGYALSDNVENLTLIGNSAIDGTGNSLNNIVTGNAANNYLYAGDGTDQVEGQSGNDYLYGQAGDDLLNGGGGNDWLIGDVGDDLISGGVGDDRLIGGLGRDSLSGDKGKDRLTGGTDADRFIFNSLKHGFDIITDFQATHGDQIVVSAKGLGGDFKKGKISSDQLTLGAKAVNDQAGFIYNELSGRFFFDVDGTGGHRQIQVVRLVPGSTLTSANVVIA